MTWIDKTEDEIRDAILEIAKEETGITSFKEGGVLRGLAETYTKTVYPLYKDVINFYGGQFTYLKASGAMLDLRGQELGLTRIPARKTQGHFLVDAIKSGSIEKGTWFVTAGGLRFKAVDKVNFHSGQNSLPVVAEFAGAVYNILHDTPIRTTSVIEGIVELSVPENWISTPGRDEESDPEYRIRIKAKWDTQGQDNRPGKYVVIALAIPGINDVKVLRTPRGSGSVDVILGGDAGIPSQDTCDAVYQAISDAYLLTRDILVKPAIAETREFELTYSGDVPEAEVEQGLRTWLHRRKIGQMVTMQDLYQSVFSGLDLVNLEYQRPTQNIEIGPVSKIIPQSITVTRQPV